MKHKQARIIFGTAVSAAAIAVALDHVRQTLPEPSEQPAEHLASQQAVIIIDEGEAIPAEHGDTCKDEKTVPARQGAPCSL